MTHADHMSRRCITKIGLLTGLTLLLGASCIPKPVPVQAPSSVPTTFVGVLGTVESTSVAALPPTVEQALLGTLTERNLDASPLPASAWAEPFAKRGTSSQRAEWLTEQGGVTSGLVVMVETEVSFYAQLTGRYRWTVDVTATIAGADDMEAGTREQFSVPVFLLYDHEREERALIEASVDIERKLSVLLDGYIAGME